MSICRKRKKEGSIPKSVIENIANDVATALHLLHSKEPRQIIHRDVSLDNCLIKNKIGMDVIDTVLNDFDTAKTMSNTSIQTKNVGKPSYMAPEVRY